MRTIRFTTALWVLFFIVSMGVFAQSDNDSHTVSVNIPEIALLAINGGNVTLAVQEPGNPGDPGTGDSDASTRLFYTSLVPTDGFNKITAQATSTNGVPAGTSITVEATNFSVNGNGGNLAGQVTFADMLVGAQDFITDIESAYTGVNAGADGAVLTYTLGVSDYTALRALSTPEDFTVQYTITTQ